MIAGLPTTVPKEKYGPRLMEFIKGEAEILLESVPLEKLCAEGGDQAVFKLLDEKYSPQPVDLLHTALKTFFYELQASAGESYRQFYVRFTSALRLLEEQDVKLPPVVQGYLLLKKLRLEANQEAMVLTAASGDMAQVWQAVQRIFPEGKAGPVAKQRETFQAETQDEEEEVQMVMESVAEEVQDNDLSDEGAVEAFESYAEVRKRLLDKKKARGFAPTPPARPGDEQRWKLSGSVNARLESLKSRTRCHLCKRLGHWKRECPGRRHAANDSAKKEAHLVEGEVLMTEGWDESFYMDVGGYAVAPQDVSLNHAGEFEPEVLSAEIGEAAAPAHRVFPEVFEAGNVANLDASGVPDTACRKTLVGEYTLECICKRLSDMGLRVKFAEESHVFRFGNSETMTTDRVASIPARLGEHRLIIKAAVLPGKGRCTPLLLSKELLRKLGAIIDMGNDRIIFPDLKVEQKLKETAKGHYAVSLFEFGGSECYTVERGQLGKADRSRRHVGLRHQGDRADDGGAVSGTGGDRHCGFGQEARWESRRRRSTRPREHRDVRGEVQGQEADIRPHLHQRPGLHQLGEGPHRQQEFPGDEAVQGVRGVPRRGEGLEDPAEPEGDGVAEGEPEEDTRCAKPGLHGSGRLGASGSTGDRERHPWMEVVHGQHPGQRPGASQAHGEDVPEHGHQQEDRDPAAGLRDSGTGLGAESPGHKEDEDSSPVRIMSRKVRRMLERNCDWLNSQAQGCEEDSSLCDVEICHVIYGGMAGKLSVLSGSRVAPLAEKEGITSREMHMEASKQSCDVVARELETCRPKFLLCTPSMLMPDRKEAKRRNLRKQVEQCVLGAVQLCERVREFGGMFLLQVPEHMCRERVEELRERVREEGCSDSRCFSVDMCCFGSRDPQTGNMFRHSRKYITNIEDTSILEQACNEQHQHESKEGETKLGDNRVHRRTCAEMETERFAKAVLRVCKRERNKRGVEVLASERLNNPKNDKELMETIRRCHVNLGHPSRERFLYMLRTAKAKEQAIECAKRLRCATCDAKQRVPSHQVSKHRRAEGFNQQVCVDVFEVPIYQQKKLKCLSIICEGTSMHVCVPLWKGATAENVAKAYRKGWTRWAGVPLKLFSDGGTEFDKEFQNALDVQGTYAEKAAAEAPWQNGLCERNQQTWKSIFEKAFEECVPTNKQEVNQLIDQVNNSKNGMMKRHGYAPCQHVFGCSPRLPDSILNGDACVVSNSAYLHGDHDVVRAQAIRLAARRALVEADNEDKVRRAIEHRTRKERGPFSVGDLVYYYRKLVGAKGVWKGPGRIIGMLENRSRIWVCHGNKVLRCCPEQLRGLSEDQEAAFRLVPMEILRRRHEQPSPGAQTFSDISGEGVPPDDWEPPPVDRSKRPRVSFEDTGAEEERPPDGAAEIEADGNESTVMSSGSVHTASQPASRRPSVQGGSYGPAPRASQGRERRQEMMSTARPSSSTAGPTNEQIQYAMDKDLTLEEMRKMSEASHVPVPEDDEGLQVELKMAKDALEVNLLQLLEEHAKGIETELETIQQSDVFMAQQLRNAEVRERDLSAIEIEELLAAKAKEWQKLLGTGAIKVFSGPEAEILRKQIDPERILKSRFVKTRRPHPKQPGKMELKCRCCVKGYLDPDAESLQRQTLSGDGLAMVLQMIASRGWLLEIADVEGAFLQGESLKREAGPIYVEMPREEVPGAAPGSLVQLIKCVYGLMDAPRQWYDSFMATMEGLGMRRSKLDPCVLMWFDGEELGGICAVHVDDMVIAGNQKFHETVLSKLKEAYPFKHWRIGKGDFLGRYLEQKEDKTIVCSQKEYADKVEVLNISRERRRQKDQPLTTSEMRQLRGVVGAASWLVGSTRPDIAAQTAILQQRLGSPTVQELIDANKLVARIKDLSKVRITFQPIPISQVMFLAASDASWSNNDDLKTQAGYMTMAVDREIQNEVWAKMTPLRWKSYKLERRTQSTLGAELMAIARAVAEANWMRSLWAEASNSDYTLQNDLKFRNRTPLLVATDNKPIYDHSQGDGIVVKDKRVAIDMLLLKSDLSDSNVILRWLDTKQMVVDGMTKSNASIDYLLYVLKQGEFIVVRESKSLEWKAQQRQRKMSVR